MTPRLAFILLLATLASVSAYAAGDEAFEAMRPPVATRDDDRSIRIETAGAEFSLDLRENRIRITQRIPTTRPLGTLEGLDLSTATLDHPQDNPDTCRLRTAHSTLTITPDGLLRITLTRPATLTLHGLYRPAHTTLTNGRYFLPDETGGLAAYPFGPATSKAPLDWTTPTWELPFTFTAPGQLWISPFPPRPFDPDQAGQGVVHTFSSNHPFPSDAKLRAWRRYGSVLILHSWIWRGTTGDKTGVEQDQSWTVRDFRFKNDDEARRVLRTAHALGMKVLPYMSPFYQSDPTPDGIRTFLAQIASRLDDYGFDGVYFDGLYDDIPASYDLVRRTRQLLGPDRILITHVTFTPDIPCPFIDTWADYTLRGENDRQLTPDLIRWTLSGWNTSNAVGLTCYNATRPTPALIDQMLAAHARLPFWVDDGTWGPWSYHLTPDELHLLETNYLPRVHPKAKPASP